MSSEEERGRQGATERAEDELPAGNPPIAAPRVFYRIDRGIARFIDPLGNLLVDIFHYAALFAIGAATVWAAVYEIVLLFDKSHATVADLLLLFIYLEIGAMVGIYFRTSRMPVRFLVYVAITALTRLLISEVGKLEAGHGGDVVQLVWIAGSALILAIALLLLRFGSARFPSPPTDYQSQLRAQQARPARRGLARGGRGR